MEETLKWVYYSRDSPACYSGFDRVYEEAIRRNEEITKADVREFLAKQRTYTLYKTPVRKFKRLRTVPDGLNTDWQADLTQFDKLKNYNDGCAYILVCVDVLSRRIYAEPVERKKAEFIMPAFDAIFERAGLRPWKLFTDRGKEFVNAKMHKYYQRKDILKYEADTHKTLHATMAERANRSLKDRLYKYFGERNTLRWIDVLQSFVDAINRSVCRTTGMRPIDVTEANAGDLMNRLYPLSKEPAKGPKFEVGDFVRVEKRRVLKSSKIETKGLATFSDIVYVVDKVFENKDPPVYKLRDYFNRPQRGYFYEQQLVRVPSFLDNTARVERILRERRRADGTKEYYVRWMNEGPEYDSWVPEADFDVSNAID
jgi:hypothetical protein